jgi:hypothetical protein
MKYVAFLAAAVAVGLAGCSMNPGSVSGPVPVRGKVSFADGKPVRDVILTLAPAEAGKHSAGLKVGADGTFSGDAAPGKYTFFFSAQDGKTAAERQKYSAALKSIPEQYREPHADRRITVGSGDLDIRLN